MRDGENQRNKGDAFNSTHHDQPNQSTLDQPASPYLKPDGFGGFNSRSGLGLFKPVGLKLGG
jgi:hypothetical protein